MTDETLCFDGDRELLNQPRRAVLVSRTPRHLAPATPWVRAVVEAVRRSAAAGETLVTGLGRDPFDVALVACRRAGAPAIVVLEGPPGAETRTARCHLLPARQLLVWPRLAPGPPPAGRSAEAPGPRSPDRAEQLWRRDQLIAELADRAWAVWIRPGGHMARLAEALRARGCPVDAGLAVGDPASPSARPREARSPAPTDAPPLLLADPDSATPWDYLTHYTREPDGAWPDEPRAAYADWLAHGPLTGRREAPDALRRILAQGLVLGSSRLMPGRVKMVSFTARPPAELAPLVRWRQGLHRWTFRPYGIAVLRTALQSLGARPVRYLRESELEALSRAEREFAQKHSPPQTDWSSEAEWRLPGDLRLDALPRDAVRILAPGEGEARALEAEFGLQASAISSNP